MIWLVLESVELDALDLGQAVGGKERMLRSGSVAVTDATDAPSASSSAQLRVLPTRCVRMCFLPTDPSRLLVATDTPLVLQRSRYSPTPPSPEAYAPLGEQGSASGVASLAFHPTLPSHFLAGRTDGSVALYHIDDPQALMNWHGFGGAAVVHVEWSPSKPCQFWALDADDVMHIFDLTAPNPAQPVLSSPVRTATSERGGGGATSTAAADGAADDGSAAIEASRPMRFALDARSAVLSSASGAAAQQRLAAITVRERGRLGGVEVRGTHAAHAAHAAHTAHAAHAAWACG